MRFLSLCLILIITADATAADSLVQYVRTEKHMGSDFTVKLLAASQEEADGGFQAAFALIAEYDKSMSDYNSESELLRLCMQSPTEKPVAVSEPLFEVLRLSKEISEQTNGAFDVTIGPLTRLWRRARRQRELPTEEERHAALESVGYKLMDLDQAGQTVALHKARMRLDLGGIAPGFAADRALARLKELGIPSALVDASGDVTLGDAPPGEKGWKVAIGALKPGDAADRFLLLSKCAIATSGDAYRGVEIDGVRYSHIVDPATGIGLKNRSSVSVIAPNGGAADALATALSVLGPDQAAELLKRFPECHYRIVRQDDEQRIHIHESPNFKQFELKR